MSKHVSLAQTLAQLDQPAPVDFDPEDISITNAQPEHANELLESAGREHYVDVGPSTLRSKVHESLSDPKYEGVRISRKQLESDADDLSDDVPGSSRAHPVTSEEEDENSDGENDEDTDNDSRYDGLREHAAGPLSNIDSAPQRTEEHDPSITLKRAREEERTKGKAVARQLVIYDRLLDARIRLQKLVSSTNRLPDATDIPYYLASPESRDAADRLLAESMYLADDLFELQEKLLTTNEAITTPARKRRKVDQITEGDRDWEEELQESTVLFAELEATFHPRLLTTLQKWSNKVLAIAPAALLPSNRTKFSSINSSQMKGAVQLVDEALLERNKLLARTQNWRGSENRLPSIRQPEISDAPPDSVTTDVFDDTDFYQTLLRDIIDARAGAEAGLGDLSADWRASQQQRKKARRSTVDTRASKGRKLRYEVHEKLQNFMAPAPPPGGTVWHEEQIDELFASLLGKGFPDNEVHEESREIMDVDVENALRGGFRVFG